MSDRVRQTHMSDLPQDMSFERGQSSNVSFQGRGRGGVRGGRGGGRTGGGGPEDKPKREAILDLAKYVDKRVRVKFMGGRESELCTQRRVGLSVHLKADEGSNYPNSSEL